MQKESAIQSNLIEWGLAARPLPGMTVSGDLHLVKRTRNSVVLAVVDGLGHGDEATVAAKVAIATLAEYPTEPVIWLVKRCHEALARTRGVVMTIASFHALEGTLTWLGVGNVEGILLRADRTASPPREQVLLRSGLIGYQLPPLHASVLSVARGDTLVLASDGIRNDFGERLSPGEEPQALADRVLMNYFKGTDDALVLVARFRDPHHE